MHGGFGSEITETTASWPVLTSPTTPATSVSTEPGAGGEVCWRHWVSASRAAAVAGPVAKPPPAASSASPRHCNAPLVPQSAGRPASVR